MSGGGSWRSSGTAIDLTLSDSGPESGPSTANRAVERTSSSKSKRRAPRIVESSSDESSDDDDDDGDDSIEITTNAAARPVGQPPPPASRPSDQSTAAVSRQPSTAGKSFEAPQRHAFHGAQSNATNPASMFRTGPAHQKNPPPPPNRSRPLPPPPPRPWPGSGVNHHTGGTSTVSTSGSAPTSTSFSGPVFSAAPPRNHPSWLSTQRRQPFASSSSAHAPPAFQSDIKNFFTPRDPSSSLSSSSRPTPPPPRPLSVKERAMADLRAAQQRIGVPIAVPQNPPRAQTHRSTPKKNKHIAADRDDLDGLIGELAAGNPFPVSRLIDSSFSTHTPARRRPGARRRDGFAHRSRRLERRGPGSGAQRLAVFSRGSRRCGP